MKRGLFVVFEGIDGAGTTTQTALLKAWLRERGEACHTTCEPSDGPIGSLARQITKKRVISRDLNGVETRIDADALALLFAADRYDHFKTFIRPHTSAGHHVVCDRYVLSSFAYQGLRSGYAFVKQVNERIMRPDITFFLKVNPEIAVSRIESTRASRDMFENLSEMREIAASYEKAMKIDAHNIVIIDGEQSESKVHADIVSHVDAMI